MALMWDRREEVISEVVFVSVCKVLGAACDR